MQDINPGLHIFPESKTEKAGETFYTGRLNKKEYILAFSGTGAAENKSRRLDGTDSVINSPDGRGVTLRMCPATYENLVTFEKNLGKKLHPLTSRGARFGLGTGNRVIITEGDLEKTADNTALGVFPGIYRAVTRAGVPNWFIQQSIVRELIPESADPVLYPGIGHTGGYGPRELMRSGLFAFFSLGGYGKKQGGEIGADADHAIVTGKNAKELEQSLELNRTAIIEARDYTKFTVDTCALLGFPVKPGAAEEKEVRLIFGDTFKVKNIVDGLPGFTFKYEEKECLELARRYWKAVEVHAQIYEYIKGLKAGEPFDYELSLDETPQPTPPRELFFYIMLLRKKYGLGGRAISSVAPSLGFTKRTDYAGGLGNLKKLTNAFSSIAAYFNSVLCIHSGSGEGTSTGKGPGVDKTLAEATAGNLQLKVSGIYQEILWRMLAASPVMEERELFERVWEKTGELVENSPGLKISHEGHEGEKKYFPGKDPGHYFFRHHAYLVWKEFRTEVYETMSRESWGRYARMVEDYTLMRINTLKHGRG